MHNVLKNSLRGVLLAAIVAAAACTSPTAPVADGTAVFSKGATGGGGGGGGGGGTGGSGGSGTLNFLTATSGPPTVSTAPVSFWAVAGQDRSASVYYSDSTTNSNHRFLRLRIRPRTQMNRPDGSIVAQGDSILITIQVTDPVSLVAHFEPSGMQFSGHDPASLTMYFADTDHDYNHDGVINSADTAIANTFSIFHQAFAGAPWTKLTSVVSVGLDEITASIPGFSNYVIAF